MTYTLDLADEQATAELGRRLARALQPPVVVCLVGPLGAGKTRLVQAVAAELGASEEVTSPTFVLINEYRSGSAPVYHFDAYRLTDEDELLQLGAEEYFAGHAPAGPGLVFVEWGDRFDRLLPADRVTVRLEPTGETTRRATISDPAGLLTQTITAGGD
ncbi:tRNA (adenosine(37)-N6)-threonylcarbamoyltransferase complex ATPase subunit type 1 TsaE [Botrimarina sp.]|uniref:tRNA (adenosine(37)-N6)-threonylcarbamoyltransferase complex ATPase subunit type 1 TsaE n=1 Tax=Botrimarina sp. TaxID=2795802 RepID=UPI0032EF3B9A